MFENEHRLLNICLIFSDLGRREKSYFSISGTLSMQDW